MITEPEQLAMKLAELEVAITSQHPQMPQYLRQIHQQLLLHPELVHIMTNEQRSVLIAGLSKQAGVEVIAATKPKSKSVKSMSLAELGI